MKMSAAKQRKRGMMKESFGPVPSTFNDPLAGFADCQ